MLLRHLQQHQWWAFFRHPMFERNLGVRIFMFVMFGFLALELLFFGFFLDQLLLETGTYTLAIDVFNSILPWFFLTDFVLKFLFKQNQSMQIAPYLSLPVRRNRLFDFLLVKEFSSFWNFYGLFLVVPFALKAIPPYYSFGTAILYILAFYLLCVSMSLFANWINNLIHKSFWFYTLPAVAVATPFVLFFVFHRYLGDYSQHLGDLLLNGNLWVWLGIFLKLVILWQLNRMQMREAVYRELQGEKAEKIASFSSLSFLDRFGSIGDFINLEIKMILRSKRLKQQTLVAGGLCIVFLGWMLEDSNSIFRQESPFLLFFYEILTVGMLGIVMGQYIFTSESSFFDGLMSRKLSIFELLKSKYFLYSAYSLLVSLLLLIPVFQGLMDFLLLVSLFFYTIGPVYFMIFQNAVYNKTYFDLFDRGMMNWKGQSGNMVVITMITMFLPVIIVLVLNAVFGNTVACLWMLITGIAFALTSNLWLKWIYSRFLKRKYKNMEGFRSNV